MQPSGRFAPSPTGSLHAGSALAALGSFLFAKQAKGQWLIRVEDVDRTREVPGAAETQLMQLAALGLESDVEIVRQSGRAALYQQALDVLVARGDAFECHCSRADVASQGGIHRACVAGKHRPDPAWRLRVPEGCEIDFEDAIHGPQTQRVDTQAGDFVLKRSDGYWAYQLAVVVDDAAQQITQVVRGADLLDSTARQIHLQTCLGLATPAYAHLPVVLDDEGRKLSKSLESKAFLAEAPITALVHAWEKLGQNALPLPASNHVRDWLDSAIESFDPARIPKRTAPPNTAAK